MIQGNASLVGLKHFAHRLSSCTPVAFRRMRQEAVELGPSA
jgi:hypothetical protein